MTTAFNEAYYIKSKLAQLAKNGQSYTEDSLKAAIENAGMTIEEHYQKYSTREGTSANPYFNTTEYLEAKLAQLNSIQEGGHSWTMKMLIDALDKAHLTAEQHYQNVSFAFFYTQKRLTLGANQKDHFCEDALVSVSL